MLSVLITLLNSTRIGIHRAIQTIVGASSQIELSHGASTHFGPRSPPKKKSTQNLRLILEASPKTSFPKNAGCHLKLVTSPEAGLVDHCQGPLASLDLLSLELKTIDQDLKARVIT